MVALSNPRRTPTRFSAAGGGHQPPPIDVEYAEIVDEPEVGHSYAWGVISKLWNIGNYWARWAILILALWPIAITLAALTGSQASTAVVALIPLLALVFIVLAAFDPLVIAVIGTFAFGRKVLMVLATIIGSELVVGVFFSAVPVHKDPGLIPLALLTILAIVFFMLSGMKGKVVSALATVLLVIAIVSFMGGRAEVEKKVSAATTTAKAEAYPICADTEEGVELTASKPNAKLPLNMNCWSGFVSLPNNVDFRVNNGKDNDLEYLFWNGQRRFISANDRQWFGKINSYNFRLRGGGVAEVTIEPKSAAPTLKPAIPLAAPTPPAATPPMETSPGGTTPLPLTKPRSPGLVLG